MFRISIDNAILAIDSDQPLKHGSAVWSGDSEALSDWLPYAYGMYGKMVGRNPCPIDVIHALMATNHHWKILEGAEIVDIQLPQLSPGAIG